MDKFSRPQKPSPPPAAPARRSRRLRLISRRKRGRGLPGSSARCTTCCCGNGRPGRLQDRLHQRGDAAISRHPAPLRRRRVRKGRARQRRESFAGDYVRVGVECEIAVKLARELSLTEEPFTAEWMAEAIEAYYPAIEIVDDRYVKWETLGAPTLMADDFFAAGCVLGEAVPRISSAGSAACGRPRRHQRPGSRSAVPAPTCSAIPTTRSPGSPTISPPRAGDCTPGSSC